MFLYFFPSFLLSRWFDGFNWEGLRQRNQTVPILPKISSHLDTSNFDEYPMDAEGVPPGKCVSKLCILFDMVYEIQIDFLNLGRFIKHIYKYIFYY